MHGKGLGVGKRFVWLLGKLKNHKDAKMSFFYLDTDTQRWKVTIIDVGRCWDEAVFFESMASIQETLVSDLGYHH
jgi:hypothetical protein